MEAKKMQTNSGWRLFTLKSQQLSLRQKKLLFQVYNLYKIKERHSALIFQPQCHLHTIFYKDKNSTITTSTTSSSNQTLSTLQEDIATLNSHNSHLQVRIEAIKQSQLAYHSKHTSFLKSSNQLNKGHQLRQQLNKINIAHRLFLYLFQTRSTFSSSNTTHIMEQNLKSQRATFTESEKIKLSSSNKVHNFTSILLPPDAISLLNKGTNFIPTTTTTPSIASLQKTMESEVNAALCSLIRRKNYITKLKASKTSKSLLRFHPYHKQTHPLLLLHQEQSRPHFNLHLIDYVHNTVSLTREFLQPAKLRSIIYPKLCNTHLHTTSYITDVQNDNDIILTVSDKNTGWALVPTSWFSTEYKPHLSDFFTYRRIDNSNCKQSIRDSHTLLGQLKKWFSTVITNHDNSRLLDPTPQDKLQLPYMKLLPKVHKLDEPASYNNLNKLTGRPIITEQGWITSNPSRLLGTELDSIILQLKNLFEERNIPYPLIYNSYDLLLFLGQTTYYQHVRLLCHNFWLHITLHKYSYHDTTQAIITSCKLLNFPNFYRDYLLNLNNFINQRNFFRAGNTTYQQIKGVSMGSYHSRQIADLSEFSFFNNTNCPTNSIFIFCRYVDDGLMLISKANLPNIIFNLCSSYPPQVPLTFTSNHLTTHYLDLTLSLNHFTIKSHRVHHQIYQKPHHKYMYPHFSSTHPRHIYAGIIKTETIRYNRPSASIADYNFIRHLFTLRLSFTTDHWTFISMNHTRCSPTTPQNQTD